MAIQQHEFFNQLKPRLQNEVLDKIFKNYYNLFENIFSECEKRFVRKIIKNS